MDHRVYITFKDVGSIAAGAIKGFQKVMSKANVLFNSITTILFTLNTREIWTTEYFLMVIYPASSIKPIYKLPVQLLLKT